MCERKSWTQTEDEALRTLYQDRKINQWSCIAETMRTQFGILGRNGKQCRQRCVNSQSRYLNHLDHRISKVSWTQQEDKALLELHCQMGNKWAIISRQITGRTDNCVKNRFYSGFRKSIRNINELIRTFWKKKFKQLKQTFISKIVQIAENYRNNEQSNKKELFQTCEDLKNRIMLYTQTTKQQFRENEGKRDILFSLIKDINQFNKKNKRKSKKRVTDQCSFESEIPSESIPVLEVKTRKMSQRRQKNNFYISEDNLKISTVKGEQLYGLNYKQGKNRTKLRGSTEKDHQKNQDQIEGSRNVGEGDKKDEHIGNKKIDAMNFEAEIDQQQGFNVSKFYDEERYNCHVPDLFEAYSAY